MRSHDRFAGLTLELQCIFAYYQSLSTYLYINI